MAQPTYAQLRSLQTSAASVVPETIQERILTVLAMIASGQNPDASTFNLVTPGAGGAGPYVPVTGTYALSTTVVETDKVTGDATARLSRDASGKLQWGPGNAALDTNLYRLGVGTVGSDFGISGKMLGSNVTVNDSAPGEVRSASDVLVHYFDATRVLVGNAGPGGTSGISFQSAEANSNFYRVSAGRMKIDGSFSVGTGATGGLISTSRGIGSGALPTITFTSTTGAQVDTTSDRFVSVPITYTLIGSTVKVEVSPDNVTYSTVVTKAPGIAGDVDTIDLFVPAGWYVKLTTTNATIAAASYW